MFIPLFWLANHRPALCALIAAIATAEWIADDAGRLLGRLRRPKATSADAGTSRAR